MATVLSQVSIEDFDRYYETFSTKGAGLRAKHGSRGARVFRDSEDPTLAFVLFDWDREGIQAFMKDPDAAGVMSEAGLVAPPAFTYLEEAGELPS